MEIETVAIINLSFGTSFVMKSMNSAELYIAIWSSMEQCRIVQVTQIVPTTQNSTDNAKLVN